MRIRLIRKLADKLNGVDVSGARVGELIEVPPHQADILIAEGWAQPVSDDRRTDDARNRPTSSNTCPE